MTALQDFMLTVCFGASIGWIIGGLVFIVSDWLHERKEKHRRRKESKQESE